MNRTQESNVLTPEQVADYLQIRKDTVYRYIRDGQLAAVRLGRSYRILKEDLDIFLLAHSTRMDARQALFARVMQIADKASDVSDDEVEAEVVAAVEAARRRKLA